MVAKDSLAGDIARASDERLDAICCAEELAATFKQIADVLAEDAGCIPPEVGEQLELAVHDFVDGLRKQFTSKLVPVTGP